jgi:YD repeat-containing protein
MILQPSLNPPCSNETNIAPKDITTLRAICLTAPDVWSGFSGMRIFVILGLCSFIVSCSKQSDHNLERPAQTVKEHNAIAPELAARNLPSVAESNAAPKNVEVAVPADLSKRVLNLTGKNVASGKTIFDGDDHPVETRFPDNSLISYTESLPTKYVTSSGEITEYMHDTKGNLLKIVSPDGTFETFVYDENGEIKLHRKSDGTVIPAKPSN